MGEGMANELENPPHPRSPAPLAKSCGRRKRSSRSVNWHAQCYALLSGHAPDECVLLRVPLYSGFIRRFPTPANSLLADSEAPVRRSKFGLHLLEGLLRRFHGGLQVPAEDDPDHIRCVHSLRVKSDEAKHRIRIVI